jgi:hypothetical protein
MSIFDDYVEEEMPDWEYYLPFNPGGTLLIFSKSPLLYIYVVLEKKDLAPFSNIYNF